MPFDTIPRKFFPYYNPYYKGDLTENQTYLLAVACLLVKTSISLENGRKKRDQEIIEEVKKGKDLRTVLRERLDTDTMLSKIKNHKEMPRITKELLIDELTEMKNKAKSRSNSRDNT